MNQLVLHSSVASAVRWLVQDKNKRERALLEVLVKGPFSPTELKQLTGIGHDPQLHRSLSYLDEHGLLDRFFDTGKSRRGHLYRASAIGERVLDLAARVDAFIEEHAKPA